MKQKGNAMILLILQKTNKGEQKLNLERIQQYERKITGLKRKSKEGRRKCSKPRSKLHF